MGTFYYKKSLVNKNRKKKFNFFYKQKEPFILESAISTNMSMSKTILLLSHVLNTTKILKHVNMSLKKSHGKLSSVLGVD